MSSYEAKLINFMANGPITVRDLAELGLLPAGQTPFPSKYHEMGWAAWLPMSCTTLLPYFSDGIVRGFDERELIRYLKEKVKPDTFLLNDYEAGTSETSDLYNREMKIKKRLELNGFSYPSCVEDVVKLYVEVGLSTQIIDRTNGEIHYDLVIRPLSHIDSVLIAK